MTTHKAAAALPPASHSAGYITTPSPLRTQAHPSAAQHRVTSETSPIHHQRPCFHLRRPTPSVIATTTTTTTTYHSFKPILAVFQMLLSAITSLSLFGHASPSPKTTTTTPATSRPCSPTLHEHLTRLLYLMHPSPSSPNLDLGSYDYAWRIKEQWLGSPFARCYKGPEFEQLGRAEQRRRVALYEKRRADEFWYLVRAYGREVRWVVRRALGLWPY